MDLLAVELFWHLQILIFRKEFKNKRAREERPASELSEPESHLLLWPHRWLHSVLREGKARLCCRRQSIHTPIGNDGRNVEKLTGIW